MRAVVAGFTCNELQDLRSFLESSGYAVTACESAFEALDECDLKLPDVVVAKADCADLSGYELACLIKSKSDQAAVLVVGRDESGASQSALHSVPDLVLPSFVDEQDKLLCLLKQLSDQKGAAGDTNMSADLEPVFDHGSRSNHRQLIANLLVERTITSLVLSLIPDLESEEIFTARYLEHASRLLPCQLVGIILADREEPTACLQVLSPVGERSLDELLRYLLEHLNLGEELVLDLLGVQEFGPEQSLGEVLVLPFDDDTKMFAALVFVSLPGEKLSEDAKMSLEQLRVKIKPLVRLFLNIQKARSQSSISAHRASKDPLTGVYSREFMLNFMRFQFVFSKRQAIPVSLVLLHVDNLREINSEFGYETGDMVLVTLANRMLNKTRASDLIARTRRAEFGLVLPNTSYEGARVVAAKIMQEVEGTKIFSQPGHKTPHVRLTAGWATFNQEDDLTPEALIALAHQAAELPDGKR